MTFSSVFQLIFFSCYFQISDVKKSIETVQGSDVYPAAQQMLIHQGKVLKDGTTLEENKVAENSFVVIMLTKVNLIIFYGFILLIVEMEGKKVVENYSFNLFKEIFRPFKLANE